MKAEIFKHSCWITVTDPTDLYSIFDQLLKGADFTIFDIMQHHFEPFGYTALWLLAESHFAIHSFPKHNKTYIELSSCNAEKHEVFLEELKFLNITIED